MKYSKMQNDLKNVVDKIISISGPLFLFKGGEGRDEQLLTNRDNPVGLGLSISEKVPLKLDLENTQECTVITLTFNSQELTPERGLGREFMDEEEVLKPNEEKDKLTKACIDSLLKTKYSTYKSHDERRIRQDAELVSLAFDVLGNFVGEVKNKIIVPRDVRSEKIPLPIKALFDICEGISRNMRARLSNKLDDQEVINKVVENIQFSNNAIQQEYTKGLKDMSEGDIVRRVRFRDRIAEILASKDVNTGASRESLERLLESDTIEGKSFNDLFRPTVLLSRNPSGAEEFIEDIYKFTFRRKLSDGNLVFEKVRREDERFLRRVDQLTEQLKSPAPLQVVNIEDFRPNYKEKELAESFIEDARRQDGANKTLATAQAFNPGARRARVSRPPLQPLREDEDSARPLSASFQERHVESWPGQNPVTVPRQVSFARHEAAALRDSVGGARSPSPDADEWNSSACSPLSSLSHVLSRGAGKSMFPPLRAAPSLNSASAKLPTLLPRGEGQPFVAPAPVPAAAAAVTRRLLPAPPPTSALGAAGGSSMPRAAAEGVGRGIFAAKAPSPAAAPAPAAAAAAAAAAPSPAPKAAGANSLVSNGLVSNGETPTTRP